MGALTLLKVPIVTLILFGTLFHQGLAQSVNDIEACLSLCGNAAAGVHVGGGYYLYPWYFGKLPPSWRGKGKRPPRPRPPTSGFVPVRGK
ncbi:hypothetical protein Ocin01_07412 [Orchesella cincta]|uniref:Secreted protein n=1 Tax=Orchesella cincta TaxID=48709 RepID=A0A1D2N1V0_ORCCI|nr:hypothetical protein Ocin01_07412 [Orchesella cincta]